MSKFNDIIRFLNEAYSDVPVKTATIAPKVPVTTVDDEDEDLEHEGLETPEQEQTEELTGQEDEVLEPKPEELSDEDVLSDDELLADKEDADDESVFGDEDDLPAEEDATGHVRSELGINPEVTDEEEQIGHSPIETDTEDREEHNARVREKFKAWRDAQRQPKDYGM